MTAPAKPLARAVERLVAKVDALTDELAKLTERIDRTLRILTAEGATRLQAQVALETKVKTTSIETAAAQLTTDRMVDALDTRVERYRDEVIQERKERLESSVPPPPAKDEE